MPPGELTEHRQRDGILREQFVHHAPCGEAPTTLSCTRLIVLSACLP
jgi:hypothetical protein